MTWRRWRRWRRWFRDLWWPEETQGWRYHLWLAEDRTDAARTARARRLTGQRAPFAGVWTPWGAVRDRFQPPSPLWRTPPIA